MKKVDPFHIQLRQYMDAKNLTSTELCEKLEGTPTIRTIQKYRLGELVTKYEGAKRIFEALRIRMSHDDLKEALDLSREYAASLYKDKSRFFYEKHIRIRLDNFNFGTEDPGVIRNILDKRIGDEYGYDDKAFTMYITDLIQ